MKSTVAESGDSLIPVNVRIPGQGRQTVVADCVAEEVPVALVYNGISHAVMMATPVDLEDFALGFSLSEGILETPAELHDMEILRVEEGFSLEMTVATERIAALKQRRRNLTGRTGCGLCGTDSLVQAIRPISSVVAPRLEDEAIQRALHALNQHQPLQIRTGATHGAAWCDLHGEIVAVREDVGRHNALDKLIGALCKNEANLSDGFVLVSSRASYEMVHKSCAVGIGALVAVSAATSLAVEQAKEAGQMLVGFARPNRHLVYRDPHNTQACQST